MQKKLIALAITAILGINAAHADTANDTEAELVFQRSLSIRENALGKNHPHMANSLKTLADLYKKQGKYAEAESLYRRSLLLDEKLFGSNHPHVADGLDNLAAFYVELNKYAEAETLYRRSFAIREKALLGQDHQELTKTSQQTK